MSEPDASDRVHLEYKWLREFSEEFARTAWRRLGDLSEDEIQYFYDLVHGEHDDLADPKMEPGFSVMMAIAEARIQHIIDIQRRADDASERYGSDQRDEAAMRAAFAHRIAKEGRWRREKKERMADADLPF